MRVSICLPTLLLAWLPAAAAAETGWPTFRGDAARSGVAVESLGIPLRQAWVHEPYLPPSPAWPPPARLNM
jgi:hypothetical protein